ncbi:unnamed protein product [Cylicocyclus nassatus]|uniref:Uncharacterized protein n=1 Tax=Cylicocyclus nassatus TaxID=53992 RepID=A0AA36MFM0_CYLNA|nr:unnamed protein product [Cylicocyclus nassatus]
MGATDVLPYPRRRSSIHLEPMTFRLPGEVEGPSFSYEGTMQQLSRLSMEEKRQSLTSLPPRSPPVLQPLRVLPKHALAREQSRSHSSENFFRPRSQSVQPMADTSIIRRTSGPERPMQRPREARRRIASDNEENTAQFIEKLRKELISQVHRPCELEIIRTST